MRYSIKDKIKEFAFIIIILLTACDNNRSSFYLGVEGESLLGYEVMMDGEILGKLRQVNTKPISCTLDMIITNPGKHKIVFKNFNGDLNEIEIHIERGENYAFYSPDKKKIWINNIEYNL